MENSLFYTNLVNYKEPVNQLLLKTDRFQQIPNEWYIVVTDIKGSTASVKKGFSELVNLIATGSIIAALNIAKKHTIDIPFFFGGDGATLIIPPLLLKETMEALVLHKENIKKEFDIHLRVGNISVSNVYENNQELKIAKASINKLHVIPVVLGNGLHYAEKTIKARDAILDKPEVIETNLDLEGMECRWNKISPPDDTHEVVAFLINALVESKQAVIFQEILEKTDHIYGPIHKRNPISVPKLKLNFNYSKIKKELKTKNRKLGIVNFLKVWFSSLIGEFYYLSSKNGRKYLQELTQLSDILVID
ncbi:DUF3095 domain-containing protein, partial [Polaribacter sp.]|nr:DUF3095 domain-containing protein [Polaribacter sp.]